MAISRAISNALAAIAVVGASSVLSPAFSAEPGAQDGATGRFHGFLKIFDFFLHDDDEAPKKPSVATRSLAGGDGVAVGIEIPLDGAVGEGDFLYLESGADITESAVRRNPAREAGFATPSVAPGASLMERQEMRGASELGIADPFSSAGQFGASVGSFTPRHTALYFGVSLLPDAANPRDRRRGLELGMSTSVTVEDTGPMVGSLFNPPSLIGGRRIFNVGLNVGYGGVTLGASFQRDREPLALASYDAYDVGVKYQRGAFSTSLQYAGSLGSDGERRLFGVDRGHRVHAFEFGAAYRLAPGVSFAGSVQYFNYGFTSVFLEDDAAVFYLGTNVSF